ncbi:leucine-rich repeat-containing protein 66 isoform 2-T3 [Molossus nigricans]
MIYLWTYHRQQPQSINNAIHSISLDLPSPQSSWVKHHRSSLRNGLPHLRLLILHRNKLSDVPRGLWKLKSLQNLDLSFNGILQIGVSDFYNCLQMKNLYLRNNKIFKIHPEAFKDLKTLQVVDLSNNALTAVLPMVIIALKRPHLEADLAGNQWQCDDSMVVFQNLMSESWRGRWGVICNKSVGPEEAYWWAPRSRVPRETQLPHPDPSHTQSLPRSKAAGPGEGSRALFSAVGKKDHAGPDTAEPQGRPPRRARSAGDADASPQDLALAVCLAVFITFFVAFCLGALARPYVDRLWQQRCRRKRPGPDRAYSNEGFYDDIEVAGNTRHPRGDLHQACHGLTLRETHDPFPGPEASPQAAVVADRPPGLSRAQCSGDAGAGRRKGDALRAASLAPRAQPSADGSVLVSAKQGHIHRDVVLGEITYETEALGHSLGACSTGVPVIARRLGAGPGSTHTDSNELDPPPSRGMTAAPSKTRTHTKAQKTGENKEGGGTEQLPLEFSKDMQVGTSISLLKAQEQRLKGTHAEQDHSTSYSSATLSALGQMDRSLPVSPPGWGSDRHVTPADEEPAQKHAPPDTQYELDTNYDSDEGSLFTLSSVSTEGARNVTEEEADDEESCRSSEPPGDGNSVGREGNVMSFKSLEDITFQKTQGKCENQKDRFEKPLISAADSGLYESRQENASTTYECENQLARSLGSSPSRSEIPAPQLEAAGWHCSLRDLDFFKEDSAPQTAPCAAEVPSGPEKTACRGGHSDTWSHEPFLQGTDTDEKNNIPFRIPTGGNARPSQQGSEGGNMHSSPRDTDAHEGSGCPLEDPGSRDSTHPTQLLQLCSHEPALRCGGGGGECSEEGSKRQAPSLQELPNKTSSLRTQAPLGDGDWGRYSEENVLQLGKDDSNFLTQMQTQKNLMGVDGCLGDTGSLTQTRTFNLKPKGNTSNIFSTD